MTERIVWITGASSGIGEATALELAKRGYKVAVSARSEDKLKSLAENKNIYAFPLDVTDPDKVYGVIKAIEISLGPIDIAVLNAGTYLPDSAQDFTSERFKKQYEVNVFGVANCIEPLLKRFYERDKGHIAITASVAGYRGLPSSLGYGSSKAALINLAEALAIECADTDIKIQVCCPGFVKTPLTEKNDFPMPMLMEVKEAAKKYADGLESDQFEINFPVLFSLILKTIGLLPNRAYISILNKAKKKRDKSN